jgi:hypothetical protein
MSNRNVILFRKLQQSGKSLAPDRTQVLAEIFQSGPAEEPTAVVG